jgi:hypothetical protein
MRYRKVGSVPLESAMVAVLPPEDVVAAGGRRVRVSVGVKSGSRQRKCPGGLGNPRWAARLRMLL